MVVVSMMGQRFDGDEISRVDRQHRFERSAEITPMDRFGGSRDDIMVDPAGRPGMTVYRCHSCLPWVFSWRKSCVLVAHAVDVATIVTGIALRMCCAPLFAACGGTAQQWTRVSSKVRAAGPGPLPAPSAGTDDQTALCRLVCAARGHKPDLSAPARPHPRRAPSCRHAGR